jgi:hypothetical protein
MVRRIRDPELRVYRGEDEDELPDLREPQRRPPRRSWEYGVKNTTLKKQVSIQVPIEDWRMLRDYSARRKLTVVDICRTLLEPGFERLRDGRDPLAG